MLGYLLKESNVKQNGTKTKRIQRFSWGAGEKMKKKGRTKQVYEVIK